jgi:hypothetical protein
VDEFDDNQGDGCMDLILAKAALRLGNDLVIMDSYWKYHTREQNWFFSPNGNLDGAANKPGSFPGRSTWDKLSSAERKKKWAGLRSPQRMTIATLAGFGHEGRGVNLDNGFHIARLCAGYARWRPDLYSVFWSDTGSGKHWLCNVFVGDAIYLAHRRNFVSGNRHYYDPLQIYRGMSPLRRIRNSKDVLPGDIVVFGDSHVEIVTEIRKYGWYADDGFCSIGAGRGNPHSHKLGDGQPKCDHFYSYSLPRQNSRELEDKNNSYYQL